MADIDVDLPLEDQEYDDSPDAILMGALAELGGDESGARVMVFRLPRPGDRGNRDSYIRTYQPSEFGLDVLRDEHGGGDFRVKVIGRDAKIIRNQTISIEKVELPPKTPDATAQLGELMMRGFAEMANAIKSTQDVKPQGLQITDVLGLISTLSPMFSHAAAPVASSNATDPIDMLTKIIGVQKLLQGDVIPKNSDGETDSGAIVLKAIETFGKPLAEMMAKNHQQVPHEPQPMLPMRAPVPLPSPNPVQQSIIPPNEVNPEDEEMGMRMALLRPMVLMAAANDADPETYANLMLDNFGEDQVQQYIFAENWFDQITQIIPEAPTIRPWLERVRAVAIELLTPEAETGTNGENPVGVPPLAASKSA